MPSSLPFAILAPVPLEHLKAGLDVNKVQPFVAYGTRKWELLRKIDDMRGNDRVPMLIYPSHEDAEVSTALMVTWFGWYAGHVDAKGGAHPSGTLYRPITTLQNPQDNKGYWAAFWHIEALRELPTDKHIRIGKIEGFKGGWRKEAPPRGPELVSLPDIFVDQD